MARATVTVTDTWTLIASGVAMITVYNVGQGELRFNEVASDTNATRHGGDISVGHQFHQDDAGKDTYVRVSEDLGTDWILIVETV